MIDTKLFASVLLAYVAGRFACRLAKSVTRALLKTFVERHPTVRAKMRRMLAEDKAFNDSMVEEYVP